MLLDARGNPIATQNPPEVARAYKRSAVQPVTGEAFAPTWAGDIDKQLCRLPGGGYVQFNLNGLNLADFRTMKDHYQISATLAVMTFMLHQMQWEIECDNAKIKNAVSDMIKAIWTPLIRALSQAFWAGYSPNILQWENVDKYITITKIKDQIPEESWVHWKKVDGYAPPGYNKPQIKVYDGFQTFGSQWPIPVENTLWYPLLMDNGDYTGRKLLRPVFTSYYFSILIHMFANRYFERFGEPVPVGRASYEEEITIPSTTGGTPTKVLGADLMVQILQNFRNHSVVVLPNDRTQVGTGTSSNSVEYDYQIEYLESQLRGADFERYLIRLDEEISLGLFTPLLILRTADVGSYNLGSTHWNMYLTMLNALAGDMKYYIDNFMCSRFVDFNFGTNAARATIKFRKMADDRKDVVLALLQTLMGNGTVRPDLQELGEIAGLTFEEVKAVTDGTQTDPNATPAADKTKSGSSVKTGKASSANGRSQKTLENASKVVGEIAGRIAAQVNRYVRDSPTAGCFEPAFGYERQLEEALILDGVMNSAAVRTEAYRLCSMWLSDTPVSVFKNYGSLELTSLVEEALLGKLQEKTDV